MRTIAFPPPAVKNTAPEAVYCHFPLETSNETEPITIVTSNVPEVQRDNIAAAVLDGVMSFFESAANRVKYEAWLEAREQKKALSSIGQCK